MIDNFSKSDAITAQIKRFCERFVADDSFRDLVASKDYEPGMLPGFDLDPESIRPVWEALAQGSVDLENVDLGNYPLAALWKSHLLSDQSSTVTAQDITFKEPTYTQWRQRQSNRCDFELGKSFNSLIPHCSAAFELSDGCSVNCWFCGVSAEDFKSNFKHSSSNKALWRDLLASLKPFLEPSSVCGILYWATDPLDNPDLLEFYDDYRDVVGHFPAITTALAVKRVDLCKALLARGDGTEKPHIVFSVLSLGQLRKIHALYTPLELADVRLVLQMPTSSSMAPVKVVSGKVLEKMQSGNISSKQRSQIHPEQESIACVTGFLINMATGNIKLITPCRTQERWPLGYKIVQEKDCEQLSEFVDFIESAKEKHFAINLKTLNTIRFHRDAEYIEHEDGFSLATRHSRKSFTGNARTKVLSRLIERAAYSYESLLDEVKATDLGVLEAMLLLNKLFDNGLLDESHTAFEESSSKLNEHNIIMRT